MRGSFAVWCITDEVEVDDQKPTVELHFNIWCGLPNGNSDVLDIGFLFKETRTVQRILLYIPGKVILSQIQDLSKILKDPITLSAVFNDTLEVANPKGESFEAIRNKKIAFRVMHVDVRNPLELTIEELSEANDQNGTIIAIEQDIIKRMASIGDHYIRLRLQLSDGLKDMLVSQIEPSDTAFASSFYKLQMIEFRLNERRNFSPELRSRLQVGQPPNISAVHYFLIRDLSVEMVQAHSTFRKMRRLEPDLWISYLSGLGSPKPEDMIIYHWREIADVGKTVEDFIALTSFRQPGARLSIYVLGIVLLGSLGSATQAMLTALALSLGFNGTWSVQLTIMALLGAAVAMLYLAVRPKR
ncbi:MAG: hypothetical protein IKE23_11750 [Exiguobacterium sp.]|nr:hypothetical protein [Exiguobacterium sp.]